VFAVLSVYLVVIFLLFNAVIGVESEKSIFGGLSKNLPE